MTDTLPGIRPAGQLDWIRMMLFSFPGWGKSSLVGTAAQLGRLLIIRSSMDLLPTRILKVPGVDEYVADTWEKMLEVQDFLRMSNHGYQWVAWDCPSVAQDVLLDDIWEGTVAAKPTRAWVVDDRGRKVRPNTSPTSGLDQGEYGRNMERIQQWVRHIVGAQTFHFIMTGHAWEGPNRVDDVGGVFLQPWIQGKGMISKLCGYCNIITFLEVVEEGEEDEGMRRAHFRPNSRWYAKDLYDAFPDGYLDDPTMPKIVSAIESARGKALGAPKPVIAGRRRAR